jgi:hypothetical protein
VTTFTNLKSDHLKRVSIFGDAGTRAGVADTHSALTGIASGACIAVGTGRAVQVYKAAPLTRFAGVLCTRVFIVAFQRHAGAASSATLVAVGARVAIITRGLVLLKITFKSLVITQIGSTRVPVVTHRDALATAGRELKLISTSLDRITAIHCARVPVFAIFVIKIRACGV